MNISAVADLYKMESVLNELKKSNKVESSPPSITSVSEIVDENDFIGDTDSDGTSSRKENGHSRNNSVHHVTKVGIFYFDSLLQFPKTNKTSVMKSSS